MMNYHDNMIGLDLFMIAAMVDHHDLSTIYRMMRMSPQKCNVLC